MKRLIIDFLDSHTASADQLAKIIAADWPPVKVKVVSEDLSEKEYEVEHTRNCSDCMAILAHYVLD